MRLTLALTLTLLAAHAASAQAPKPAPTPEAETKLEKFQARTGAVIIKGYSVIGTLAGTGGVVEVQSMEFTDAQSGRKEQGVVISVQGSGRYDRPRNSFIDYDEIDSLLKGIEYIGKIDQTATKLTQFEAIYRTRGDFSVTTFNSSRDNSINVVVSSGSIGGERVYLKQDQLNTFRELILMAKGKLDSAK